MRKLFMLLALCSLTKAHSFTPVKVPPAKLTNNLISNYSWSGGFVGASLKLFPDGTYADSYSTDVVNDPANRKGRGRYYFNKNALSLVPDNFKGNKRAARRSVSFYIVRWGHRVYLVGRNNVKIFCDDIRAGNEPRTPQKFVSAYHLREGDEAKPVSNWPTLPKQFQHLLPTEKFDSYRDWQQNKPKKQTVKVIRGQQKTVEKVKRKLSSRQAP